MSSAEIYLICHNCHADVDNKEDSEIIACHNEFTNHYSSENTGHSDSCEKCQTVKKKILAGNTGLLMLLANDINYCAQCNTYIMIEKGRLFNCDQCNDYYNHCRSRFIGYSDLEYQIIPIENYGIENASDGHCCECLNYHDISKIDAALANLSDSSQKTAYLAQVLNMPE
jgi:hypothetical protein